jgi:hypothetical protein
LLLLVSRELAWRAGGPCQRTAAANHSDVSVSPGLTLRHRTSLEISIRIDDFRRTTRLIREIGEGAAVHGPAVEDGGDKADDQRAADGRPES